MCYLLNLTFAFLYLCASYSAQTIRKRASHYTFLLYFVKSLKGSLNSAELPDSVLFFALDSVTEACVVKEYSSKLTSSLLCPFLEYQG